MTFYTPSRKVSVFAIVALVFLGIMGTIFFFSFKECNSSGIMSNGKTSDATDLYQVFPVTANGKPCLLSLEGVYITRIYNRQGGITQRSGFTDIRLSLHDLTTGEMLHREVLGDSYEANTRILGAGNNTIWLYNKKDGLHSRNVNDFKVITTQQTIKDANTALSEGFAMANENLTNLNELFAYDSYTNSLMLTTLSGKKVWVDAANFTDKDAPAISQNGGDMEDLIQQIIDKATLGKTDELNDLYAQVVQNASDMGSFSDISHTASHLLGGDSCEYNFDGNTVRTITRSNCMHPKKVIAEKGTSPIFIEPVFLTEYSTATDKYINPSYLGNDHCILFHAKAIGDKTDLLISSVNTKNLTSDFTTKTGIVLSNHRTSYNIGGAFCSGDTLFININDQLFSISKSSGKINWKTTICKDDYYAQLYYIGSAMQNNTHYFICASSYETVLSREGFFINSRTDRQILVIDAATGKTVNKLNNSDEDPSKLPYYLGMANGQCWFYSKANAIHARSIPDLKITENNFNSTLQKAGIDAQLVTTNSYDDAIEDKYIAMDAVRHLVFLTMQNGLHYQYDLSSKIVSEVKAPEDKNYEDWMSDNPYVEFYRSRLKNRYQHELLLPDGRNLYFESNNSTSVIKVKEPDNKSEKEPVNIKSNQFIEGEFLTNAIALDNRFTFNDVNHTPVNIPGKQNALFILHKDKISPEAHQLISMYNTDKESTVWKNDISATLGTQSEIVRIYSSGSTLYFILKTHPNLDDNFTCVAIDGNSGKTTWMKKF